MKKIGLQSENLGSIHFDNNFIYIYIYTLLFISKWNFLLCSDCYMRSLYHSLILVPEIVSDLNGYIGRRLQCTSTRRHTL